MNPQTETELTIQEAATQTGLSEHTLRYYERIGLISPIGRAPNGHRRYYEEDIGEVVFVKRLRATGMPIAKIRRFAELQHQGDATAAERRALLEAHRQAIKKKLEELSDNLALIEHKIAYYSDMEKRCSNVANNGQQS